MPDFPSFIPKPKEGVDIGHVLLWTVWMEGRRRRIGGV